MSPTADSFQKQRPFITLRDVSLRLQDKILFRGTNWEILENQRWAIVGPNGSGKSVLMKAVCGTVPVVQGSLIYHFDGKSPQSAPQNQIKYVAFQKQRTILGDGAFYQSRWNSGVDGNTASVADYLSDCQGVDAGLSVGIESESNHSANRQQVVEHLELANLLQRQVGQLSNGERRRVTIAKALASNPQLVILDDPFAGLDEHFRESLRTNLENLCKSNQRLMIVGTNLDEMPSSTTHVLHLANCQIIRQERRVQAASTARGMRGKPTHDLASLHLKAVKPHCAAGTQSRTTLVRMENVNVSYNGTQVLKQVDWTIRENERWALLGPNGAGKTTLLSLILADNPQAYANDITLFGRRRGSGESIWEIKQQIGWIAPELQLYYPSGTTCLAVVCSGWFDSVGLYRQCSPGQLDKATSLLRNLGLVAHAEKEFRQVSEGQQRLVLMARALVKNPALLVLDEPCQGLDSGNRDLVLRTIDSVIRQSNMSMIYVTHRVEEIPRSTTHVMRLNEGQVVDQIAKKD